MKLFMVNKGELEEIKKAVFSTGDVYLIDDENTIYVWIGSKCSVDEKTAGAAAARTLDQERGGSAKIITVDQGQETAEFLKLIGEMGAMKIVDKNYAKTLLKDVQTGDWAGFTEWKNILYQVSSEEFEDINAMKMKQVPFSKDSLVSEDCFVLDMGNKIYVWQGKSCNVKERIKAGEWARTLDAERAGAQNEMICEEGDDAEFLAALEKGENYKESDAVQLRAESELEAETEADKEAAEIQPETKAVITDAVVEEPIKEEPIVEEPVVEEVVEEPVSEPPVEEELVSEKSATKPVGGILTVEYIEGRRRCPQCGNDQHAMIRESIDKTNLVSISPRMYGKKYKCGQCGVEWREK